MKRIAINGLGRIGRLIFRHLYLHPEIELVAVNDLATAELAAHLIQYDSAHGIWQQQVKAKDNYLIINNQTDKKIAYYTIENIEDLPWKQEDIDIVIECTGRARTFEKASVHLQSGAKKVIISAPGDSITKTIVLGINDDIITDEDIILSNASCTTNCLAPIIKVLEENFGIESAFVSTVHAYTADQKLHDGLHKTDFRRARAAAANLIPTTTNAAKAVELVMPEVKGKMIATATRVPVLDGSLTEVYCNLSKPSDIKEVNQAFKTAAESGRLKDILEYTEAPLVSSDIVGNPHSCIFDAGLTDFIGDKYCKIVGWYDNEYGYSCRLAELILKVAKL
ncbi:MAG: type I glyceraldehyde-3-phosphate dehydrogenase [Chitinophagales bacterium]|nr:type I glyceraldehyde-3-phosphate dehydrogenase [Chitinophagales bacterium]